VLTFGPKMTHIKLLGSYSTLLFQNGPPPPCGYSLCEKNAICSHHTKYESWWVIEEVLHKWQLPHDKMITTDSTSNMEAAFRSHLEERAATEEATPKNKKRNETW